MKRILFFHDVFPCGGTERVTIDIANNLSPLGYEFFLLTCKKREDIDNIRVIELSDPDRNSQSNAEVFIDVINTYSIDVFVLPIHVLKHIDFIIEQTHCKLVFALHSIPLWEAIGKIPTKQRRARHSLSKRIELYLFSYPRKWLGIYDRRVLKLHDKIYRKADAYVVLCEEYKNVLLRRLKLPVLNNKFRVIPNSEQAVEPVSCNKKKKVLFVGRLSYADKRVDRLIDIWGMIYQQVPDWELVVVGDGEEENALHLRVMEKKIGHIRFEGFQEDVSRYYREASVLCLTSTFEGWPLCLTEAQINGVVPVAFDCCAGIHQILAPSGVNGILVPPFNKQRFAKTLLKLLKSPEQLAAMKRNVLLKAEEYSPQIIGQKWMKLFESLLEEK